MADGSRLAVRARTSSWSRRAKSSPAASGGEVEGELGHVAGGEDVAAAAEAEGLTDPDRGRALRRGARGADLPRGLDRQRPWQLRRAAAARLGAAGAIARARRRAVSRCTAPPASPTRTSRARSRAGRRARSTSTRAPPGLPRGDRGMLEAVSDAFDGARSPRRPDGGGRGRRRGEDRPVGGRRMTP